MKLVTHKSKNLLYRIVNEVNTTVQFGTSYAIATQQTADTKALVFTIQGRSATDIVGLTTVNEVSLGKLTTTFTTPSSTRYNYIRFGLDGSQRNTMCNCPIDLKPSTIYTFTCNFTNITQGSISWKDMMLVEGSTVGDYEPYSYNLLDKWQYPATQTINGVTFTNNGDGTIVVDGTASDTIFYRIQTVKYAYGHIYLLWWIDNNSSSMKMETNDGEKQINAYTGAIFTSKTNDSNSVYIDVYPSSNPSSVITKPVLYDLTLMYGAGKEPTTVSQFYTDHPELKVSPLGFIALKNLEISNKNIKRLKLKISSSSVDLGVIPSNSGYILDKYNNLSEELLEENIEKDNINYHIPDKTNISLNKVEGKTNKIVQLADKSKYVGTSTNRGVTFTNNGNGTFTINGTNDGTDYSNYPITDTNYLTNDWLKGHKYLFYFSDKTDLNYYAVVGGNTSKMEYTEFGNTSTGRNPLWTILSPTDNSIGGNSWYILRVKQNAVCTNELASPQVFDLTAMYGFGNEPTTVEQFKKDYPQFFDEKLDSVLNVRTSGISTTGKNLFDINNCSIFTQQSNGEYKSNKEIGVSDVMWTPPTEQKDKQITVSGYIKAPVIDGVLSNYRFNIYYTDGTSSGNYLPSTGDYKYNSATSISGKTIAYVGFTWGNFTTDNLYIKEVQIEEGSTATDYEPYQENKIDLLSIQTLNGINGVNDYIEVIDKGNGLYDLKKTQNIDSVDLGTLDWAADGANFYSSSISSVIKPPTNDNSVGNYTCQKYVNVALSKSFVDGDFGVNSSGRIYFRNSAYTTAAAFKTAMNGVILYYQLKTPVITTIATNLTYNQVSAIRTNGGLLLVNDNNNQKYVQPDVTLKENFQYKS